MTATRDASFLGMTCVRHAAVAEWLRAELQLSQRNRTLSDRDRRYPSGTGPGALRVGAEWSAIRSVRHIASFFDPSVSDDRAGSTRLPRRGAQENHHGRYAIRRHHPNLADRLAAANTNSCPDDSNPCTNDICAAGICSHPAKPDGTSCPTGVCRGGQCVSLGACDPSCGAGTTCCAGVCVDLQRSKTHCGSCGKRCRKRKRCRRGRCR